MNRLDPFLKDEPAGYNDLFASKEVVDERLKFAVNMGNLVVRTLDMMMAEPRMSEQVFELGSGESGFEVVVRRKTK